MANLQYSSDIINDALFRAGEPTDGTSDFDSVALIYLNRAYRAMWMGGTEFDPTLHEDWWWLHTEASLILNPSITTGTVSVTNNDTAITFSSAPAASVAGYHFKTNAHADVFKISAHTAGNTAATLDSVYTGDTAGTANYRLMQLEYSLASDCLKVISPMRVYQDSRYDVTGQDLREMEREWPLNLIEAGAPERFGMVNETTVRFNRYGSSEGDLIRVDYDYMRRPDALTDSGSEEPLVPLTYRHVLADMTLYFLMMDKDDTRAAPIGLQAKSGLKAMSNENRSRWAYMGEPGQIYPRQSNIGKLKGPLRTESGIIIG